MKHLDILEMTNALAVQLSKHREHDDVVRILDQWEVFDTAPGAACTLQIRDYLTGEWLPCDAGDGPIRSLMQWHELLRIDLAWEHRVILAVAAKKFKLKEKACLSEITIS
jgi:hypothetical protein